VFTDPQVSPRVAGAENKFPDCTEGNIESIEILQKD